MTEVDARGLSCPEPVVLATEAVKSANGPVKVLVDEKHQRDNILKLADTLKKKATVTEADGEYVIVLE